MIILPLMIKDVTVNVTANLKNIEVQKNVLDSGAKGLHASDVVVGKARLSSYIDGEVITNPTIITNFIRKNINYNNDINYVEVNTKNYDNSDFYDIYRFPLPANNPNEVTDYIYGMIINNIRLSNPLELKSGKISLQSLGFDKIFNAEFINKVMLLKNRSINSLYLCNELIKDMAINQLIFKDILNEYNQGSKIIVLSERKEHLSLIEDMLNKAALRVYLMTGEQKKSQRDLIMKQIKELDYHESYVLLATSTLLGEGFDLPELRTLFLTMPISGESRLTQYTGRIQRNDEGKDVVKVYDYVDVQIPMMQTMFHKRLKHYQNIGYGIYEQTKESSIQQVLFENSEVKSQLIEDIENTKKEIVIFTTALLLSKIKDYFSLLSNKYSKGIKIYFVLSDTLKNKQLELKHISGIGASFQFIEHNKHFVVIDRQTVWNLDFDIFGYNKADGYGIRISDNQLINDILKEISITSKRDDLTLF